MATIHVDVVSAEESIFSGEARFVALRQELSHLAESTSDPEAARIASRVERSLESTYRDDVQTSFDGQLLKLVNAITFHSPSSENCDFDTIPIRTPSSRSDPIAVSNTHSEWGTPLA